MIKQSNIRSTFIFFFFCLCYAIILFNLYLIQIRNHDFYANLGQKQYHITVTQSPPRAPIYDRTGSNYLALNKDSVSAFILPRSIESPETLLPFLKKHFPQALERLQHNDDRYFLYIKRRLSDEQIKLIQDNEIPDIKLLQEPSRYYPVESAAQTIGITDIDNAGIFGIELQFNSLLAGSPTTYTLEKDARSGHFYFQKETKIQGASGQPITLTLDSTLQFLVHEALKAAVQEHQAKEGSALIINPTNGEILTMTNFPDFDPNDTQEINMERTKNKIITDVNELGSVMKVCAAIAALESGVVTLDEPIDCEGKITTYYEGRRINTVPQSVAGIIPFAQVVSKSNNIGTAKVAKRVGPKLYDYYKRLGFGDKTGIQFPGEQSGFVNHPDNWSKQSIISMSYGYEVTASLLQLARAISIIAQDGYDVIPHLLLSPQQVINKRTERLFSQKTIDDIKTILIKKNQNNKHNNYILMYKTGTANILVNGEYDRTKNRFTCAGILEKGSYKRVIVVFIHEVAQKNKYAATVAAPLLEKIAKILLIHDKII